MFVLEKMAEGAGFELMVPLLFGHIFKFWRKHCSLRTLGFGKHCLADQ
jgi:hypothetical protein